LEQVGACKISLQMITITGLRRCGRRLVSSIFNNREFLTACKGNKVNYKTIDILDLISFDNIYLLNDWIYEKPNILDEEDLR